MKYLQILPLLALASCTQVTDLNDNVNMTTDMILQNVNAVEQSTHEIRSNTQMIKESTRVMKENQAQIERMKNS